MARCLLGGLALLAAPTASARAQPSAVGCGIDGFPAPTLCARAGLDTLRASYIVLLDESGSMRPIWDRVRSSVATFIRAVPAGDELDVRLFADAVRQMNAPAPASPSLVAEWSRQLTSLPQPTGAHTDLGAALEKALAAIAASPPGRQTFVYLLTDGRQDPAPGSRYPATWGGGWPELAATARALAASRPVSFAILRLSEAAEEQLLIQALPGAQVVPLMTGPELTGWFAREARNVAVRKLRLRIAEERRTPALLHGVAEPLALGTSAQVVPRQLRRTLDAVLVDSISIGTSDGARIVVAPSEAPDTVSRLTAHAPESPWYLPPPRVSGRVTRTAAARVRFEPATELGRIGMNAEAQPDSVRVDVTLGGVGLARHALYWGAVAAIAGLLGYLILRARWATHTARLSGRLRLEREDQSDEAVDLTAQQSARYVIPIGTNRTLATLEARNERGRTTLWVVPDAEPVTVNRIPLEREMRVTGPLRLEHRDLVVHYFPN